MEVKKKNAVLKKKKKKHYSHSRTMEGRERHPLGGYIVNLICFQMIITVKISLRLISLTILSV